VYIVHMHVNGKEITVESIPGMWGQGDRRE
jgi:hypothetical protein